MSKHILYINGGTMAFSDIELNRWDQKITLTGEELEFLLIHVKGKRAVRDYLRTLSSRWEDW